MVVGFSLGRFISHLTGDRYKTYANRYRDWLFPVDRVERELAVTELYALLTGGKNAKSIEYPVSQSEPALAVQPKRPRSYLRSQGINNLQPKQPNNYSISENYPSSSYIHESPDQSINQGASESFVDLNVWTQGPRFSGNTNSHMNMSTTTLNSSQPAQHRIRPRKTSLQQRKQTRLKFRQCLHDQEIKLPKHDFNKGLWNSNLRVIPCQRDHSRYSWEKPFKVCKVCGFSQCHALMIQARNININRFREALSQLRNHVKPDFAGNYPLSFLMAAGVGMEYFIAVLWDVKWSTFERNSFTQSPLHVLNPKELGDELIDLLKLFPEYLSLRDSRCRTFLHYLFLHPLKRGNYLRVLQMFPNSAHYLEAFDTSGKLITQFMQEAASSSKLPSQYSHDTIFDAIDEINQFLMNSPAGYAKSRPYGFLEIARGARGNLDVASDFFLSSHYKCLICQSTAAHSSSYYDQMLCACERGGIDRNAPDENGWTAAHLIVTHIRHNNDSNFTLETPAQTAELFQLLICSPELREALHVLDPNGNSLVYNIATHGHSAILEYALNLEEERRRYSMVNCFGKSKGGEKRSVLEGVEMAVIECEWSLKTRVRSDCMERTRLIELCDGLKQCRIILKRWGAEIRPNPKKRWRIY